MGQRGTDGPIATKWKVEGYPTVYVLDSKGVIRFKLFTDPGAALDRMVDDLVKEAEKLPK